MTALYHPHTGVDYKYMHVVPAALRKRDDHATGWAQLSHLGSWARPTCNYNVSIWIETRRTNIWEKQLWSRKHSKRQRMSLCQLLVQNGADLSLRNNMVGLHCTLLRSTTPKYVHVYQKSGLSTRETTVIEKALKQTKRVVASVVSIACSKRSQSVTMQ